MINPENNPNPVKTIVQFFSGISSIQWNLFFIFMGLGIAIGLFCYGTNVHYDFRVQGDAWTYMAIAHQFTSFNDALHYVGARTPGFPLFEYLFLFLDSHSSEASRVIHICLTLFILHELTVLWVCFICIKCRLFKTSSMYSGLLFFVLAAYPAMVMHTTTPMTDVFGMDLLLIGFSMFAWANDEVFVRHPARSEGSLCKGGSLTACGTTWRVSIFTGMLGGVILGYAILVRPAYWIGVVSFLAVYLFMTGLNRLLLRPQNSRRAIVMCLVGILSVAAVILPVMNQCSDRFHTTCLQDPNTFNALEHMKVGLSSARTPWTYGSSPPGIVPSYPDAFLVKYFHDRCPVTSVTGNVDRDNTNLLSCFYHAPHLAVVYFIKKVTGLFDTFRMTPYTEPVTPTWYIWVARCFSSLALVGFWILMWEGAKGAYQLVVYRKPVSALIAAACCFCIIQVSMHSVLHVEERFALPWIPFCIIALFLKIKQIQDKNYPTNLRWLWLNVAELAIIGYFIQILTWDYGMSHAINVQ